MTEVESRYSDDITLETPIKRPDGDVTTMRLRKPKSGEMRGLSMQDLMKADVTAVLTLLPRISQPTLTPHEAALLEPSDLAACAGAVIGFFLTTAEMAQLQGTLNG